jgi:hypothetical protein
VVIMLGHRASELGYSMGLWAIVLAVVGVPALALAIDATQLMQVQGDLQEAADAAAEAAALEVDIPAFRDTGVVCLLPAAPGEAQWVFTQAFSNGGGRANGHITGIHIDEARNQVIVLAEASWHPFILGIFDGTPTVRVEGWARYRMTTR